jgi:hypothetical protein
MSPFETQHNTKKDKESDWTIAELPIVDNGYYDTLAAIGFAALADAYYETPKSPLIKWTSKGFQVHFREKLRSTPDLHWLKYSVAKSWRQKGLEKGLTKKSSGWDGNKIIETDNSEVDVSINSKITVPIKGEQREINDPERRLYSVINGLGNPRWFNLCIYACKNRGIEILEGNFEEEKITFNKTVFPLGSKGANSQNSFSITNSTMSKTVSRSVSWLTCLAVAGLSVSAIGQSSKGFAVPIPSQMRINVLAQLSSQNRRRYVNWGFFFPFDNYLNFVKLLLIHGEEFEIKLGETPKLKGVTGVNFVELGTSASPSGTWKLTVPSHKYTIRSVENLQELLVNWKREKTPRPGSDPSIDRKAVRTLVNGFEASNPQSAAEGYLQYLDAVGLNGNYINLLNQTFFEEIMAHSTKYNELLEEFKSEDIQRFIQLLRQDTIQKVYSGNGKKDPPNYQVIRRLREIQSPDDFVEAITEIAVERGSNKLASAQSSEDGMQYMSLPYEGSLEKLIELSEDSRFSPRLIAQLLLAFALSSQSSKEQDN